MNGYAYHVMDVANTVSPITVRINANYVHYPFFLSATVYENTIGVPSVWYYDYNVQRYARSRGVELDSTYAPTNAPSITNMETILSQYIEDELSRNNIVSLFVRTSVNIYSETDSRGTLIRSGSHHTKWHWMNITSIHFDEECGVTYVGVSSWGSQYYLNIADICDASYGMVSFEVV